MILETDIFKRANDLNLFNGRYDVSDNRNKFEQIGESVRNQWGHRFSQVTWSEGVCVLGPVKHQVQMA